MSLFFFFFFCRLLLLLSLCSLLQSTTDNNNDNETNNITSYIQKPERYLPKLFGELRERFSERPGGYTRVLRVEPKKDDQAPSAILELVDGPKDIRFALTARALARRRSKGLETTLNEVAATNVRKVTQFRKDGIEVLEKAISKIQLADKEREEGNEGQGQEKGGKATSRSEGKGSSRGGPRRR